MVANITKVIDLVPGDEQPMTSVHASDMTEERFWGEFVRKHQPVVIREAAQHWPALQRWHQPDYFERFCGEEEVEMWTTFNPWPLPFNAAIKSDKLDRFVREMKAAPDNETYAIPAVGITPRLREDLGNYPFLGPKYERRALEFPDKRLFIYKNASTEWHYHLLDESLTAQLVGSKRFSMFRLTPDNWRDIAPIVEANFHHMNCGRRFFPQTPVMTKFDAVVNQGDAIYIPPFWWHGIDTVDANFGITMAQCFRSPIRRFGDFSDPVTKAMIARVAEVRKKQLLPLYALLSVSSLSRRIGNEKWWPM